MYTSKIMFYFLLVVIFSYFMGVYYYHALSGGEMLICMFLMINGFGVMELLKRSDDVEDK
jgi:hypothetical protein